MSNLVIIGMQWGDEGKGKIVDLLCPGFDVVVRFQGGNNAGHTVKFGDRHFALHLIPSGILREGTLCVLGNGMVIDPEAFFAELDRLVEMGVRVDDRLFVSQRAQVLLPLHAALDVAREAAKGKGKIGTTARGIGPAYEAKASRAGVRMCDLAGPELEERLRTQLARAAAELASVGAAPPPALAELVARCRAWGDRMAPMLRDTHALLNGWLEQGKNLMFEGAQGTLLDLDHGTYPFVTSSSPSVAGAALGSGIAPRRLDSVLGVLKAYTSRVGMGPFVTELGGETGDYLRARGNEYGTTTGRPRRCGWLDLVAARYSHRLNGIDAIALTKLDVLDTLAEIPVCVAYRVDGHETRDLPPDVATLERYEPVYEVLPGWQQETVGILDPAHLPQAARDYIAFIERYLQLPVTIVSTGPRREETIVYHPDLLPRLTGGRH